MIDHRGEQTGFNNLFKLPGIAPAMFQNITSGVLDNSKEPGSQRSEQRVEPRSILPDPE
jgi:hypothetical protein